MPYISQDERKRLIDVEQAIRGAKLNSIGNVNYLITKLLECYIAEAGTSYRTYNEVVGVLECAKLEVYRRLIGNYEDQKMIQNGDVYGV